MPPRGGLLQMVIIFILLFKKFFVYGKDLQDISLRSILSSVEFIQRHDYKLILSIRFTEFSRIFNLTHA